MTRSAFAAVLASLLLADFAAAGNRFAAESRDLRQADPKLRTGVLWLEGPRMRFEADGLSTVIYRGDEDVAWIVDHRDKSYRALDRATVESLARGAGQANDTARRYIEMLPPAQRAAAERLLDQTLGSRTRVSPDIEVRPTGANETIAGVECALYQVLRGGQRRGEVCRASFDAAGISPETRSAVRSLSDSFAAVVPALAPEHLRQDGVDALHAFSELDGVPLRVRLFEGGAAAWESRVTDIAERAAPATAFELPDGYVRKPVLSGGL